MLDATVSSARRSFGAVARTIIRRPRVANLIMTLGTGTSRTWKVAATCDTLGSYYFPQRLPLRAQKENLMAISTAEQAQAGRSEAFKLRGVDHLVFNTDDMAATVAFYCETLGMRLIHAERTPGTTGKFGAGEPPVPNLRHYFFDMGNDSTIAFFEYPKGTPKGNRDHLGTMQHCALHTSRRDFDAATERLKAAGVPYVGPLDRGFRHSIYFFDNNGIRLELTTFPTGDDFETVGSVLQTREQARAELRTLYKDPDELEHILDSMRLRD
jgi:glyoxylase I family protein